MAAKQRYTKVDTAREKSVENAIKRMLKAVGAKYIKIHGTPYMETGTPDLIGAYQGQAFAIEVKKVGEEPEDIQLQRIAEWQAAGAIAFYTDNVTDVVTKLIAPVQQRRHTMG